MSRRRRSPTRVVRSLLVEILLIALFAWFMFTFVLPWGIHSRVRSPG
jgi:hypothetical protein